MTEEQNLEHVNYLDKQIVQELCHKIAEDIFEGKEPMGSFSDHEENKLDSCLSLPRQKVFGKDLYPTILEKAAILFFALNRNHPFGNGNKRVSAASLVVFLHINDIILYATRKDFFEKTLWLAKTDDDLEIVKRELVGWLTENTMTKDEFQKLQKEIQDEGLKKAA